ncbi:MAG: VTC domain-containing protein, partial [Microthrixaceae bacterium]|nr:VTC domain-containing protein [Microthrixaceae bacterium]
MSDRRDLHAPLGMNDPLQQRLDHMAPVDLDSLDGCARLHTRKDRKYIVDAAVLSEALERVEEEVRVLEIHGNRWFTYRSVYFDTPDYEAYHLAARRRPNRYKVRSRTYVDEGTTVLEVKTRD